MPKILMKEKKNMNIKRAKQEIKDSIEAYLTKDNYGEYKIPSIRQRPILLMGPPGIGKTQIMEQIGELQLRVTLGFIPFWMAVASVKALNVEPTGRFAVAWFT